MEHEAAGSYSEAVALLDSLPGWKQHSKGYA
jgi:hypothetical protein